MMFVMHVTVTYAPIKLGHCSYCKHNSVTFRVQLGMHLETFVARTRQETCRKIMENRKDDYIYDS